MPSGSSITKEKPLRRGLQRVQGMQLRRGCYRGQPSWGDIAATCGRPTRELGEVPLPITHAVCKGEASCISSLPPMFVSSAALMHLSFILARPICRCLSRVEHTLRATSPLAAAQLLADPLSPTLSTQLSPFSICLAARLQQATGASIERAFSHSAFAACLTVFPKPRS